MVSYCQGEKLIVNANVEEFFQDRVTAAVSNQNLTVTEDVVHYVVNLLTAYTNAKMLYEQTPDGLMIKPLALMYAEAVEATSVEERNQALKRLGDIALFIAGVFPNSLNRKLVDIDYYIAMGGNAYGHLSGIVKDTLRWQVFSGIFNELSINFTQFVDVLGEVSDTVNLRNDRDIMRLYEIWIRTGSERTARRLRQLGIHPFTGSVSRRQH